MNKDCWKCKQKAQYISAKLSIARAEAKTKQGTVAIVRNGCLFLVVELSNIGNFEVIEYINND